MTQNKVDKSICPEYLPLTIWDLYQEHKGNAELVCAYEKLIWGYAFSSQKDIKRMWLVLESARKKKWSEMCRSKVFYGGDSFDEVTTYEMFDIHIRTLIRVSKENTHEWLTPKQKADQVRALIKSGLEFADLLRDTSYDDYFGAGLKREEYCQLSEQVLSNGKIVEVLQDLVFDVRMNAIDRYLSKQSEVKDFLYHPDFTQLCDELSSIVAQYTQAIKEIIIPLVIEYALALHPVPLSERLRRDLSDLEDKPERIEEDSCILPRVNIKNAKQTYMIRYLTDCFYTLFRTRSLVMPVARFVGAILETNITRDEVRDALRGYPLYGIRQNKNERGE
ncbi:MAG: hypothetical protein WAQ53_07915 [Thiofilum sp.]|uniref:hypothetical protein n=1 Tax=Thiofilum sp. TaxID=2212733 RepID=UPI0025E4F19D|nr:hypothetical protein [Thiofilum sp.]MBK8454107.1 hypothetical protein [Thiofilum sp.]